MYLVGLYFFTYSYIPLKLFVRKNNRNIKVFFNHHKINGRWFIAYEWENIYFGLETIVMIYFVTKLLKDNSRRKYVTMINFTNRNIAVLN